MRGDRGREGGRVGFHGQDACVYLVCGGEGGGCESSTLTVNVAELIIDPAPLDGEEEATGAKPRAVNDVTVVKANSGANVVNVLANDSDPNGGELHVSAVMYGERKGRKTVL